MNWNISLSSWTFIVEYPAKCSVSFTGARDIWGHMGHVHPFIMRLFMSMGIAGFPLTSGS